MAGARHKFNELEVEMIDINELRQSLGAIQTEEVAELLDRLEAAESDALEQARLNGMGSEREAVLMAKLEVAEKERDWNAERLEDAIEELTALRAKIAEMEKQEPVASVWRCDNDHIHGSRERTLPMGDQALALPGAKGEEK